MSWLNVILLLLAGIFALGAVLSLVSGLGARSKVINEPYNVGREQSRRSMQIAFLRAAILAILALILFGVYGLSVRPDDMFSTEPEAVEPGVSASPIATTAAPATEIADPTPTATGTAAPAIQATATAPPATATPAATPTITQTPVPTAIVDSEVGLYLRPEPGSEVEVELLPNGTELILLPGRQTVDDLEWQEVRSPSGNEGWVAVEFITYE